MRARASDAMRRRARHWPRALLRDVPDIFEVPPWPLGWIALAAVLLLAAKSLLTAGLAQLDLRTTTPARVLAPEIAVSAGPIERGVIGDVRVREGQAVRQGDVLLRLAPSTTAQAISRLRRERSEASMDLRRLEALLSGDPRALRAPADADPALVERARFLLARQIQARQAHLRSLRAGLARDAAGFRARALAERAEATRRFEAASRSLALKRRELQDLSAPADGFVQGASALAIGSPVAGAQALLRIVPADAEFEIEARVPSRNLRWMVEGQRIRLRLAPFEAGDLSRIDGEVAWIAGEAIHDARLGSVYLVRIRIAKQSLSDPARVSALATRKETHLSADIQLDARSMFDWLTQILLRRIDRAVFAWE